MAREVTLTFTDEKVAWLDRVVTERGESFENVVRLAAVRCEPVSTPNRIVFDIAGDELSGAEVARGPRPRLPA